MYWIIEISQRTLESIKINLKIYTTLGYIVALILLNPPKFKRISETI